MAPRPRPSADDVPRRIAHPAHESGDRRAAEQRAARARLQRDADPHAEAPGDGPRRARRGPAAPPAQARVHHAAALRRDDRGHDPVAEAARGGGHVAAAPRDRDAAQNMEGLTRRHPLSTFSLAVGSDDIDYEDIEKAKQVLVAKFIDEHAIYAILSHTWLEDYPEVTYRDRMEEKTWATIVAEQQPAYQKLFWFCKTAYEAERVDLAWMGHRLHQQGQHDGARGVNPLDVPLVPVGKDLLLLPR